jgi:hypothetical protein
MGKTFCFHCEKFVDVLENKELSCGHTVADQQTMYKFLVDKVDKVLKRTYTENNIEIPEHERRTKAFNITMDFIGEWYSNHFQP